MIALIFETVTAAITGFAGALSSAFTSVIAIVWDGSALTTFGILLLIAFGVGIVYFAMRYIVGLLSLRGGRR